MQNLPDGDIRLYLVRDKVKEVIEEMRSLKEEVNKLADELKLVSRTGGKTNGKKGK